MSSRITRDTPIEDLVQEYPEAVGFLTKRGVRCIRCGEAVWGSLGKLLEEDGVENPQALIDDLDEFLALRRQ